MILIELSEKESQRFYDLMEETSQDLKQYDYLPKRTLVFRPRGVNDPDYYEQEYSNGKKILHPLGKGNNPKVIAYKRQRFLQEELKVLTLNKKAVDFLLSKIQDYSPEAINQKLPAAYRDLSINNCILGDSCDPVHTFGLLPDNITKDDRFLELVKWANEEYKRNPYPLPDDPNIAIDGTPMRSKGECMWYDDILFEGLPKRTDPEIILQGISGQWHKLYPDFVFKCFDGTYIYVEHFGDWADEEYAERNKRKIQEYLDCNIVLGDNLIVTSDNANHRTNELMILEALDKIKKRMFA